MIEYSLPKGGADLNISMITEDSYGRKITPVLGVSISGSPQFPVNEVLRVLSQNYSKDINYSIRRKE